MPAWHAAVLQKVSPKVPKSQKTLCISQCKVTLNSTTLYEFTANLIHCGIHLSFTNIKILKLSLIHYILIYFPAYSTDIALMNGDNYIPIQCKYFRCTLHERICAS